MRRTTASEPEGGARKPAAQLATRRIHAQLVPRSACSQIGNSTPKALPICEVLGDHQQNTVREVRKHFSRCSGSNVLSTLD
jgi:hypothetical protein